VHKDGRVVWANLTVAVLRDEGGRLAQQFAMIEDITERREAEERLRRSEQRFRRFVENANEILYSLTADGHFLYASPIWTNKLGHAVENVVGHPISHFVHPDDLKAFWDFLRHVLKHGRSMFSVEYRMLHRDGHYRWHASSGAVYFDESGEKLYMGVARDITERKRNQEELRAALARREELARIIHRSPSVVVLWRATEGWPVEFVSQNVAQFGYTAEEILANHITFLNMVHPDDRPRISTEIDAHAAAGHREYSQEYRIVTRDGSVRWIDDRTVVRVDPDGRVTHHEGILTDITERKAAEQREAAAHERDLQTARDVQRHLLPNAIPAFAGIDVDSLYIPSRHIGGDYFDFFEVGQSRWAFVVADVSGKGASAALIMAACRTALRIEAARQPSPVALLRAVNRLIRPDMPEGMFISIIYGVLDLQARVFTFCRAGHETPIVVRATSGTHELPDPAGMALGLDDGPIFDEILEEKIVPLAAGDLLVLYTDGITEVRNDTDEEFGRDRLVAVLAAEREQSAAVITTRVDDALRAFAGTRPPPDDRTLVIVRMR
jgi:PAS domain S-box-containing protein